MQSSYFRYLLAGFLVIGFLPACFAQPSATRFQVTGYEVLGVNPLSVKDTQAILAAYLGEHEGLEGIQAAVDALESELRAGGYSFLRVILPPQTLEGGVVKLEVVEFKLGQVKLNNNRYFDQANIRRSLPALREHSVPNTRKLARQLNFANRHSARQLALSFSESETGQSIDATIDAKEQKPASFFTVLQNTGTEETGDWRLTLGYQHTNLFNRDHGLALLLTTAEETDAVQQMGLSYHIPFYSHAGSLTFSYSNSDVETGQIEDLFQVSGKGSATGLTYRYHIPAGGRYRHSAALSYENKLFENDLTFDGQLLVGNGSGDVRTNPLSLSYQGTLTGVSTAFDFSLTAISNQPSGSDSDAAAYALIRDDADPNWSAFRYSLAYDWRFSGKWALRFRYLAQQAGEPLLPGEQFGLGGANSVRGYAEREILGDNGWQSNVELWLPPWFGDSLNWLVFVDSGEAEYEDLDATQEPSGTGVGLRWSWRERLAVRADFAKAGEDAGETEKGDTYLHLSAFYRF